MAASKAKRRENNQGSIRKRPDGRWEARFIIGYEADGTPKRRSVYVG